MKIKILFNTRKEWAKKLVPQVAGFLKSAGFEVVKKGADTTICIGGDGTILYYNNIGKTEGAVLGIGSSSSHICILRNDNWRYQLIDSLKNNKSESRLCISASVSGKNKKIKKNSATISAINDIVVHTIDYRVITIRAIVNGVPHEFSGDGIIVSTPTGSSAYAYSAGGDILKPQSCLIELVPICPYKRTISHVVLDENAEIEISSNRDADLIIDGIHIKRLKDKEAVKVKKGKDVRFLVL
ncbi:MAG: hypothetical protein AABW86_03300 [Candidatus Micrarchaeota archaeon]